MCKRLVLGGLVGGILFFVWSVASWMFIPWHSETLYSFKDEMVIKKSITENVNKSGVYVMPAMKSHDQQQMNTKMEPPIVFATVMIESPMTMNMMMGAAFVIAFVTAFLLTWLASKAESLNYFKRVGFIVIVALTAGIMVHMPYWNWFGFPVHYTLVMMADQLIGWLIAGLAIAKISMKN